MNTIASKLTVFSELRFSEQIMSVDKYPSLFSRQMEAIVYRFCVNLRSKGVVKNASFFSRTSNVDQSLAVSLACEFLGNVMKVFL